MESSRIFMIAGIVLFGLLYGAFGHSYVTSPASRSIQSETQTGCRGPACLGPCDVPESSRRAPVITAARGSSITVKWPRNNHAGGFIRFAWAPTGQSDSMAAFDANVQQINCHEVGGCGPDNAADPNGGDSGPSDGSSRACTSTITVPADLADGAWTLQWAWFGGAFSLGDYFSCVDYQISGGASGASVAPVFKGGDYTYPGQNKCKFFNTNKLHQCINEPCNNPIFPLSAEQSGIPDGFSASSSSGSSSGSSSSSSSSGSKGSSSSSSTSTSTSTSGKSSTSTSTSTSGKSSSSSGKPSTTGKAAPSTTGKARPSTTGKSSKHGHGGDDDTSSVPAPTPVPVPTPAPSGSGSIPSGSCNSGYMRCLTSETYSMCAHEQWGVSQSCAPGTHCSPSGNYIYCV